MKNFSAVIAKSLLLNGTEWPPTSLASSKSEKSTVLSTELSVTNTQLKATQPLSSSPLVRRPRTRLLTTVRAPAHQEFSKAGPLKRRSYTSPLNSTSSSVRKFSKATAVKLRVFVLLPSSLTSTIQQRRRETVISMF